MGSTPLYALPYPEGADPPGGHLQMRALAEAMEAAFPLVQAGDALVSVSGSESGGVDVTFEHPFASTPIVVATPASVAGSTGNQTHYTAHVTNLSPTGCRVTLRHYQAELGSSVIGVTWVAVGEAA